MVYKTAYTEQSPQLLGPALAAAQSVEPQVPKLCSFAVIEEKRNADARKEDEGRPRGPGQEQLSRGLGRLPEKPTLH